MSDASDASDAVASELERALVQVARAVAELIPGHDVFEPRSLVRCWMARLESEDRGRFLILLLSDKWEAQLGSIAQAVIAGRPVWPAPAPVQASAETMPAEATAEAMPAAAAPDLANA
ncbi:MAG TPA: hypothetical protein VGB85_18025 [Nannocystis sp.]|jgi:hypothetical protein